MVDQQKHAYDIFISYAREDSTWVREHLYRALLQCRFPDGRRPRIFYDVGEEGIQPGQSFPSAIAEALRSASRVVPVYTSIYFCKDMCKYELEKALQLDPTGSRSKLTPIMISAEATQNVPFYVNHINYLICTSSNWFERLCRSLGLETGADDCVLEFLDTPQDVFVNHTLPVVRVVVRSSGHGVPVDELIALSNPSGTLQGTTAKLTEGGIAVFDDLSVSESDGATRLVAKAAGMEPIESEPFAVHVAAQRHVTQGVSIPSTGEALFFESGKALAVVGPDRVAAFRIDGTPLGAPDGLPLRGRLRLVRRSGGLIALGDWAGNVYVLDEDGRQQCWAFGSGQGGFVVPADIDLEGGVVYVGFWNGSVYRLSLGEPPQRVALQSEGVQALGVHHGRYLLCDFAGQLRVYCDGRLVNTTELEPTVWMLRSYAGGILAVGDYKCYRLAVDSLRTVKFEMPIKRIASVYEDTQSPVAIDATGKGVRFNAELMFTHFHTIPGAVPVSADDAGAYCVFRNPDGSRTLLVGDRIVFTHPQGTLAVSPDGGRIALGEQGVIRLLDSAAFLATLEHGAKGV